jgi:hypothetical protein
MIDFLKNDQVTYFCTSLTEAGAELEVPRTTD